MVYFLVILVQVAHPDLASNTTSNLHPYCLPLDPLTPPLLPQSKLTALNDRLNYDLILFNYDLIVLPLAIQTLHFKSRCTNV